MFQCVSDACVSLDMYPEEPDSVKPPSSPVGKVGSGKGAGGGTPKAAGTQKAAKGNESFQGNISNNGDGFSQFDLETIKKTIDAHYSVKKYIVPALKGLSPKNQVEVDEALIQQNALKGSCMNI